MIFKPKIEIGGAVVSNPIDTERSDTVDAYTRKGF